MFTDASDSLLNKSFAFPEEQSLNLRRTPAVQGRLDEGICRVL